MARHAGQARAGRTLIVGCGALARELVELTRPLPNVDVACLPPALHNRPGGIPARVRARIRQGRRDGYERIFVAYADCGTGGLLEPVLAEEGVERLPGAHCYEFFAGRTDFAALADQEPATFWLTDFLARNFERLVIRGLGIDRNPELEPMYFGNYKRLVYLSQTEDPDLLAMARRAAERLGLAFEHRHTGYGELATSIFTVVQGLNTSNGVDSEAVVGSHWVGNLDTLEPRMSKSGKNVPRVNKSGVRPATRVARVHGANTRPNASTRTGAA